MAAAGLKLLPQASEIPVTEGCFVGTRTDHEGDEPASVAFMTGQ